MVWNNRLFGRQLSLGLIFVLFLSPWSLRITEAYAGDVSFKTGFDYTWWESTKREKGQQALIPLSLKGTWGNFDLKLLTGYLYCYHDIQGEESHDADDLLDTKVNLSYLREDVLNFDILFGLDFNVPTGRTNLSDEDLTLIMDPDLVPITSWGEGLNINPTVIVTRSWDKVIIGAGGGFLWRDSYDFSKDYQDYDPGDIWRATGEIRYFPNDNWMMRFFTSYTWYGEDEVDGDDFYQAGNMFEVGLGLRFDKAPWRATINFASYFRDKDELQSATGDVTDEDHNSYGDEYVLENVLAYRISKQHEVLGILNLLQIEPNDYNEGDEFYRGRRQKIETGLGWKYRFCENYSIKLLGTFFLLHDHEMPDHQDDNRTYRGVSAQVSLTTHF